VIVLALLVATAWAASPAVAQRVTPDERKAAAERAAAKGMRPATLGVVPQAAQRGPAAAPKAAALVAAPQAAAMVDPACLGPNPPWPNCPPKYYGPYPNYANSPQFTGPGTGIRKFVDTLPGLCDPRDPGACVGTPTTGQYIPIAVPDTTTYAGSDYYEIAVVQYREKMHSDLPPTLLRGYVQLETAANATVSEHFALANANLNGTTTPILVNGQPVLAVTPPHYLGPLIVSQKDRPVRIVFRNLLPATAQGGNLFVPTDVTVMGSGMSPMMGGMAEMDPQNPMCGTLPKPMGCFPENRATLHLHGGISPWISDGTPHQWITPATEDAMMFPVKGVSVTNVSDMPDPGPGAQTFYYTNQQSARLLFYHDHSWGITRLNVYAGEAAGYLITDAMEQSLVWSGTNTAGVLPPDQIPLVIQDKTFVPTPAEIAAQDPTWNSARWGGLGNLWAPHVYVPAQNPGDASGVNQFGRWAYGPWFWPPTLDTLHGPADNPYYDPTCNPDLNWCEPPLIPGVPHLSMGMEAFNDTPLVNGTAYPTLTVDPKAYRFRILSAANDRFFNLSLYLADPALPTEVQLNPAEVLAALSDPAGVFPTPVVGTEGPSWVQIGTEGGFLPSPVVIPPQPITWVTDPTVFNAGNVDQHSLLLGPAERADVIVDFSAFAGKTLILYNDAPAAFPARDPRYDYYTGNPDLRDTGGAAPTPPGYGPNTRTVMQIVVRATPAVPSAYTFNETALMAAFKSTSLGGRGVFENSQHPIVVGQGAYNDAYGSTFFNNGAMAGLAQIFSTSLNFYTLSPPTIPGTPGLALTLPLQPKAIQDEMGEAFDKEYGRMSGNLGLMKIGAVGGVQTNLILYPYINPASEVIAYGDGTPAQILMTDLTTGLLPPISSPTDGTQIWKITHNGVDTHPIHWHLFDVQVLNRVGWDGIIRRPDLNELGWKDTVRISPLEDTIVALRPVIPRLPFGVPDSIRPLNPMMPLHSPDMFVNTDAFGNPINPPITNEVVNFGWEYVWHCHILSHEEMDMMRPIMVWVPSILPDSVGAVSVSQLNGLDPVVLTFGDPTPAVPGNMGNMQNEVGFRIDRATSPFSTWTTIGVAPANSGTFSDVQGGQSFGVTYQYRVTTFNAAGDAPSVLSGTITTKLFPPPAMPGGPTATVNTVAPRVVLSWTSNSPGAQTTGFTINWTTDPTFTTFTTVNITPGTVTSWNHQNAAGSTTYYYRVRANGPGGSSAFTPVLQVATPGAPAAPTGLSATTQLTSPMVTLLWTDASTAPSLATGFQVRRATNAAMTTGVTTFPVTGSLPAVPTTWGDTTAAGNTTYYYQVRATNALGNSAWSPLPTGLPVTTPAPAAPGAPSNLAASITAATTIRLTWVDNATTETGFTIQRATNAAFTTGVVNFTVVGANVQAFNNVNNGLVAGTTYFYQVRANNGTPSAWSPSVSILFAVPAAPSGLTATATGPTSVALAWTDMSSNENTFNVARKTITPATATCTTGGTWTNLPASTVGPNITTTTDATAVTNTKYCYRVRATNGRGSSAWVMSVPVTTPVVAPTPPAAPTGLTLNATGPTTVVLTWVDAANNETSFTVQRATDAGFTAPTTFTINTPNTTTYTDTTAVASTTYWYRVEAFNGALGSGISPTGSGSVTTPAPPPPPAAPTGLTATATGPTTVNLTWVDTANNETGFTVQRATNAAFTGATTFTINTPNTTSYIDTTAAASTTYWYRVEAFNGTGPSGISPTGTATVTTPAPSVPLTGLSLWLKADAGLTMAGTGVSAWADQSGNNKNATQGTAGARPTVIAGAVNGLPALAFNGTGQFMTVNNMPVNGLTGMTLVLVSANTANRTGGPSQAETAAVFWNETAAWGTVYLSPFQTNVKFRFGTTQVNNWPSYTRPASIGSAFSRSVAVKNGTTDTLYVNGASVLSQGGKLGSVAATQTTLNVGRGYDNNTYFPGRIAEILVYGRALNATELAAIEAYLTGKYGP
jgi:FtsP/CotA-like multicopper oxidase with cupredoxin domain